MTASTVKVVKEAKYNREWLRLCLTDKDNFYEADSNELIENVAEKLSIPTWWWITRSEEGIYAFGYIRTLIHKFHRLTERETASKEKILLFNYLKSYTESIHLNQIIKITNNQQSFAYRSLSTKFRPIFWHLNLM